MNRISDFLAAVSVIPVLLSCSDRNGQEPAGPAVLAMQNAGEVPVVTLTDIMPSSRLEVRVEAARITENVLNVSLRADISLVPDYNEANGTDYQALPTDAFELTKPTVLLPRYNTVSSTAEITVTGNDIPENGTYLLPVVIDRIEGEEGAGVEEGKDVKYFLIERDFPEGVPVKVFTISSVPQYTQGDMHALCLLSDDYIAVGNRWDNNFFKVNSSTGESQLLINPVAGGFPYGITLSPDNKLYIAYKAGKFGMFDLAGTTPADPVIILQQGTANAVDVLCDSEGNLYALCRGDGIWSDRTCGTVYYCSKDKMSDSEKEVFVQFEGEQILSLDFDLDGNLIVYAKSGFYRIPAEGGEPVHLFGKTGAADVDGPASDAVFMDVYDFAIDPEGNIWMTDYGAKKIKLVRIGENPDYSDAVVETIAGGGVRNSTLTGPRCIDVSSDGTEIYFTDASNHAIQKITVTEEMSE